MIFLFDAINLPYVAFKNTFLTFIFFLLFNPFFLPVAVRVVMRGHLPLRLIEMGVWLRNLLQLQNPILIGYGGGQNLKVSSL